VYPNSQQPHAGVFCRIQAQQLAINGIIPRVIVPIPYVPPLVKCVNHRYAMFNSLSRHSMDGEIKVSYIRYLTTPSENIFNFSHLTQRLSLSRLKLPRPDLIHAHFAYPVGAAASGLAKKWEVPLILTLHGDDVTIHPHASEWHRRRFAKTIQSTDCTIAISEALAQQTEQLSERKPRVLSPGIDLSRFLDMPERTTERKRLGIPINSFVILYIGSLLTQKGVRDLAEAFHRSKLYNACLIFIGDGPQKPQGQRIVYFGKQPNDQVPFFLAAADLLVLPSHHEGLGQVILEAGAARVPVIGAATGGIVNLLSENRGWLFPPKDVDSLARCLTFVQQNPIEAKNRTIRLYQHILKNHVLSKNAEKLIDIYHETIRIHGTDKET